MGERKLTVRAESALRLAQTAAKGFGHGYVGCEHLLLGLLRCEGSAARRALLAAHVTDDALEKLILRAVGRGPAGAGCAIGLTPRAKHAVELAADEAMRAGLEQIGTEHLLMGLLRDGGNMAVRALTTLGVDTWTLYGALRQRPAEKARGQAPAGSATTDAERTVAQGRFRFTRDLTELAREGRLDPVIGREREIDRTIRILSRRTKNNPVLIGEAGVGKTAVAEGLAERIALCDVPEALAGKRLLSLDLTGMVAGTRYRGEFEERVRSLLEEAKKDGNVIFFIDELHNLVGAGAAEGAIDAANILKPALARGELSVVGATTQDEYSRYIERDAALERRFQSVRVEEPDETACLAILRGLRPRYESHHRLRITDEALGAAVKLSRRYLPDRRLPDKAVDLMDEAAARVRMEAEAAPPEVRAVEQKLSSLHREKADAIAAQDYERAARLRDAERSFRAQAELARMERRRERVTCAASVTEADVARVVSDWTGVPVTRLSEAESERLLRLEKTLHARVVGQDEAVSAVARAIRRERAGIRDPRRPIGSFLFLGPTGVGKTELCRALAEAVFGDENAMLRFDMSEYMEKHSVSRLVGAPPGYMGCDEGGQLTEGVRRKPYALLLFDEIEKAHRDVWDLLLQILDEGVLTDARGRKADFSNTVIVMTGNVGAGIRGRSLGFSDGTGESRVEREAVTEELRRTFRPEFLNRIDETVVFRRLTREDTAEIARRMLESTAKRVAALGVRLDADEEAVRLLAETGFDERYGARALRRVIRSTVEDAVAERLLSGHLGSGGTARLTVENGALCVR